MFPQAPRGVNDPSHVDCAVPQEVSHRQATWVDMIVQSVTRIGGLMSEFSIRVFDRAETDDEVQCCEFWKVTCGSIVAFHFSVISFHFFIHVVL